jgi:hypothetical protein
MRAIYYALCGFGLLMAALLSAIGIPPSEFKETLSPFEEKLFDWMLPLLFLGAILAVLACGAALIGQRRVAFVVGVACVSVFHVAAYGADRISSRWGATLITVVLLWPFVLGLYVGQKTSPKQA